MKRTNGQEGLATDMITAQRAAKRALEVLRKPTLLASFVEQLPSLQAAQVRKVRAALRMDGIREIVEKLEECEEEEEEEEEPEEEPSKNEGQDAESMGRKGEVTC